MEGEYQGRVKDGKLHGVGVCLYTDGSRYQGDWKAGLKSGRGTHSFASGDQFEGEWENGWMHGLGVYTWKIGDKYIGEVRAALRRLSGPAEDSCPSLACAQAHVAHSLWLLGASAAYLRAAARHLPAQKRSLRRSTRGASLRANSPGPLPVRQPWPWSRRCSLGGSTASARTRGARTASTWGSGRRARCTGMASRLTRQVLTCGVVGEATAGGGSAPCTQGMCRKGYIAAHGTSVRHLVHARLGRLGRARGAPQRVALCALQPPSSRHRAAPPPTACRIAASPHRRVTAPPAGNIFEGDWKEGKPQLKDTKSKDWANLLPWLNETVPTPLCGGTSPNPYPNPNP